MGVLFKFSFNKLKKYIILQNYVVLVSERLKSLLPPMRLLSKECRRETAT